MKFESYIKGHTRFVLAAILMVAGATSTQLANAWTNTLTDGNTSVTILPDSPYGMNDMTVDGKTQLYRQWFFYRKGNTGPEKPINNLTLTSAVQSAPNVLNTVYHSGNTFSIDITYVLQGGLLGSGSSSIGEQIKISNLTGNPLNFHFFQYVDFDLGGNHLGDTVALEQNAQGLFEKAYQTKGNFYFSDEVVSPAANHGEVGLSESTLVKLMDANPTTLNDNVGPVTGDAIWAFQWDMVIPAYQSFDIAINKGVYVVPEPSAIALLSVGLAALSFVRRRIGSK